MTDKPAFGSPCNNCGVCCRLHLCPIAETLFQRHTGPCPALIEGKGCGLMIEPDRWSPIRAALHGSGKLSQAAALILGAGAGCDYQGPGERVTPEARQVLYAKARRASVRDVGRARAAWGV